MIEPVAKIPQSLDEFQGWSSDAVQPRLAGKSLIFSPGGSSRWYFMEYGDTQKGYLDRETFLEYSRRTLNRILEATHMMMVDGIETVFVIAFTPQFDKRDSKYQAVMGDGLSLMVDEETTTLYEEYGMHVKFRGMWETVLGHYGQQTMYDKFCDIEKITAKNNRPRLIWCIQDKPIPDSLMTVVQDHIRHEGEMPDKQTLAHEYYGETNTDTPLFIGNNKPSIGGQLPPFLSPGDLYFTVSPTLYLNQTVWRNILFDHLFARQVTYRNYTDIDPDALRELREFYQTNQSSVIGVGQFNNATQTWRPVESLIANKDVS